MINYKLSFKQALIFIIFVPILSLAQSKLCNQCKKPISNEAYFQIDENYFHKNHFLCAQCSEPITGAYYERDGKYYDESCYEDNFLPKCAHCGKTIDETYTQQDGRNYHKSCFINHIALKCDLCNGPIIGGYLSDYWGNHYHEEHDGKDEQCNYCRRFISNDLTNGGYLYEDQRKVCGICYADAIVDLTEAKRIFDEVKKSLEKNNISINHKNIPLQLVDKDRLSKHSSKASREHTGFTHYNLLKKDNTIIEQNFQIHILYGLPRFNFISTASHELMHVWQHLNAVPENDAQLREGSCNLAAFLVLNKYNDARAKFLKVNMLEEKDPVYGGGFRKVKKFYDEHGHDYWLEYLKREKNLP